ncbi:MAG: hypothetical protein K1Y02_24685 [Candidatus Hydrogenedentes bacterium]|nr:hypothetical protein [Candidatus Hydrogenedentota bacterium]
MKKRYFVISVCALLAAVTTTSVVYAFNPVKVYRDSLGRPAGFMEWFDLYGDGSGTRLRDGSHPDEAYIWASRSCVGLYGSTNTASRAVVRIDTNPDLAEDVRIMGISGAKVEIYRSGDVIITLGN